MDIIIRACVYNIVNLEVKHCRYHKGTNNNQPGINILILRGDSHGYTKVYNLPGVMLLHGY
jgi:hypothetical protein